MSFFLGIRVSHAGRIAGYSCLVVDVIPSLIHLLPRVYLMIILAETNVIQIFDIS